MVFSFPPDAGQRNLHARRDWQREKQMEEPISKNERNRNAGLPTAHPNAFALEIPV